MTTAECTTVTAKGCLPDLGFKIYLVKATKVNATDYLTLTKAAEVIREAAGTDYGFYMDNILYATCTLDTLGTADPVTAFTSGIVQLSVGTGAVTVLVIGY